MDAETKRGTNKRLIRELNEFNKTEKISNNAWSYVYSPEVMKYVLEEICQEYSIDFRYHSRVFSANVVNGSVKSVQIASFSGMEEFSADLFIDASGNGDLGAFAGAEFRYGHPETGLTQPMTMMGLLTGIDKEKVSEYIHNIGSSGKISHTSKLELLSLMKSHGIHPSYEAPTLWHLGGDLYGLMAIHVYKANSTDSGDVTKATVEGRKELFHMIRKMSEIEGWENVHLVATAEQIGIREGRRISGLYRVTRDDLIAGTRHNDGICRVTLAMDVHSTDPQKGKAVTDEINVKTKPYDIPARALVSKDIKNLLMAGRCISGDFFAHASYRVTGNSVASGEGAAYAAWLTLKKGFQAGSDQWRSAFKDFKTRQIEIEY